MEEKLKQNNYTCEIIFEQSRFLNAENLKMYSKLLKDYLLKLNEDGSSEFKIQKDEWEYLVWSKKLYLYNNNNK